MSTLIINGSPRGKNGNTEIFIRQFLSGAGEEYPVRYAVKEDPETLAEMLRQYDTLLIFMPLYVHAMPGIVMKLFEQMRPCGEGQKIGFVVQAGFIEGAQARFLVRYLDQFAGRLGYENLGTVTNSDAAGTSMLPEFMNRKRFKHLNALGAGFAGKGQFDREAAALLAGIYELTPQKVKMLEAMNKIGVSHIMWKKFWRDNGQLEHGLDRPFQPDSFG